MSAVDGYCDYENNLPGLRRATNPLTVRWAKKSLISTDGSIPFAMTWARRPDKTGTGRTSQYGWIKVCPHPRRETLLENKQMSDSSKYNPPVLIALGKTLLLYLFSKR